MGKKELYEEKLRAQLREWDAKIDVLKAKAEKAEKEIKVDYYDTIEEIKEKRNIAREKIVELQAAGDDAWKDLKDGVENAWSDLSSAVKAATERFK